MVRKHLIYKLTFIFWLLFSLTASAQNDVVFNKTLIACEDEWVIFPKNKDSVYIYAFIYFDVNAGLTANIGGSFKRDAEGKILANPMTKTAHNLVRLSPSRLLVAVMPQILYTPLNVEKTPQWLKSYKIGQESAQGQYMRGFMHNAWNNCQTALFFLEKAKKLDANISGLNTEIAFSYNCLKRFKEAVAILEHELEIRPNDAYVQKELVHALVNNGRLQDAEKIFNKAESNKTSANFLPENAYNILYGYFLAKDAKNFSRWIKTHKKLIYSNKMFENTTTKLLAEAVRQKIYSEN